MSKKQFALGDKNHKVLITMFVFAMVVIGVIFGISNYGADYVTHNVEIINVTLGFVNTALLLIIVGILVRMESRI